MIVFACVAIALRRPEVNPTLITMFAAVRFLVEIAKKKAKKAAKAAAPKKAAKKAKKAKKTAKK